LLRVALRIQVVMLPFLDMYEMSLLFVEFWPFVVAAVVVMATASSGKLRCFWICFIPVFVLGVVSSIVVGSYKEAWEKGFDLSKPTLREAMENYVETGQGDLEDILALKTYPEVFGRYEIRNLFLDLFRQAMVHSTGENAVQMPVAYNKGHDWFEHTLGKAMVYTGAIYENSETSLYDAQIAKLDHVAQSIGLQAGDKLLDIGCGWGRLIDHMSATYGADATGITLSSDQKEYAEKNIIRKPDKARIVLHDFMTWDVPEKSFDKITSLEMFEHVGIRYYTNGLRRIHKLLKDDGTLYFQVAGLRPQWQWRDFIWGMFMNEHVFPGADASTPLYWVVNHLERAGFEVQRVHNMGSHYSRTLNDWLSEWRKGKDVIVGKYGAVAWRRWEVFLRWSVQAALEGSSTVMMITATKYGQVSTRVKVQDRIKPTPK
jgi:cyclopropane fatty-acyl-phospholipid synthase-like methyltransferase